MGDELTDKLWLLGYQGVTGLACAIGGDGVSSVQKERVLSARENPYALLYTLKRFPRHV